MQITRGESSKWKRGPVKKYPVEEVTGNPVRQGRDAELTHTDNRKGVHKGKSNRQERVHGEGKIVMNSVEVQD